MWKREFGYFFNALMFYTNIPCPAWPTYDNQNLNKSRKYLPLIGWLVGGIAIAVFSVSHLFLFLPASVAVLLSIVAAILATGALHEDGFADACDGFGAGADREQILRIMQDSRLGTYGVIGILCMISLKFLVLCSIQQQSTWLLAATLLNGHVLSRYLALTVIRSHDYVRDPEAAKAGAVTNRRLTGGETAHGLLYVSAALLLSGTWSLLLACLPAYLAKVYAANYFKRRIGGYTGDCLGAVQQLTEVVFYLAALALHWSE